MYPIYLKMEAKKVAIVGGGKIAYRKALNLLESGADLKVIAPEINSSFFELGDKLEIVRDKYNKNYIEGMFLVIAATNDKLLNENIHLDCREKGILCNIVSDQNLSDFISPAIVDTGGVLFSISSKGAFPKLSKHIKEKLKEDFSNYSQDYVELLRKIREYSLEYNIENRDEIFEKLLKLNKKELESFYSKLIDKK